MSWFVIDDKWHSHPKVVGISLAAAGLWAKAGSWCGDHLTDGAVPRSLPRSWGADAELAQELVTAGLWIETEAGWQFHDWLDRNPSRESILAKRKADADRKAKGRASQAKPKRLRKESERSPRGLPAESNGPSPSPSPNSEERESARPSFREPAKIQEAETAWIRLGRHYQALFNAEQEGSRNPRIYDEQRIVSTDAPQFRKLAELVRAESQRTGVGQRAVFEATALSFLRDSKQQAKGLVLEFFVRDFAHHATRSLEAAS